MDWKNMRNLGQPWIFELKLKDALYPGTDPDDITEEQIRSACVQMHERLMAFHMEPFKFRRIGEPDVSMPNYGRVPLKAIAERFDRLGKSDLVDAMYFNQDLDLLYDWADVNRVLIK